jgi:hypothetical protein
LPTFHTVFAAPPALWQKPIIMASTTSIGKTCWCLRFFMMSFLRKFAVVAASLPRLVAA